MSITADAMRQSIAGKDTVIPLTELEWQRMRDEIDVELNKVCDGTCRKDSCFIYCLRSFVRDAPNKGKMWSSDARDARVESSLQDRGFTVEYIPLTNPSVRGGANRNPQGEIYSISWPEIVT